MTQYPAPPWNPVSEPVQPLPELKAEFPSAIIVPNYVNVNKFLSTIDKYVSGNEALVEHPDVIELIKNEVDKAMDKFSNYEKVKVFKLLPDPFTIEKGELTPKMSIVRKIVEKNHHELIESIYE